MSISDADKISTDIAMKSWQRIWNEDGKGRRTYELIPKVNWYQDFVAQKAWYRHDRQTTWIILRWLYCAKVYTDGVLSHSSVFVSTTDGQDFTEVIFSERSLYADALTRLSVVCLSVTLVHPTQAVVIFRNISTALGTLAIRWHHWKFQGDRPREPLRRGS